MKTTHPHGHTLVMFDRGFQRIPSGLQLALALLSVPAVAAISAFWLANYLSDSLLRRDAELTRQFVQSAVASHDAATFFARPHDEASSVGFERFLDQVMRLPDVTRANVYSLGGEVVWSSSRELIGEIFADNDELRRASLGALVVESGQLEVSDKSEHVVLDRVVDQWFVESYIPIRDAGSVIGVIELYKLPNALSATLNNVRLIIWVSATFVAVLLAGSILWFKAARRSRGDAVPRQTREPRGVDREIASERAPGVRTESSRQSTFLRPPPQWGLALTTLALVLTTPVAFGIYVMHVHGVERNGTLGELADQEQSLLPFAASAAALLLVPPSSKTNLADESALTDASAVMPVDVPEVVAIDASVEAPADAVTVMPAELSAAVPSDTQANVVANEAFDTIQTAGNTTVGNTTGSASTVKPAPAAEPLDDAERVFWESVADSDDPMLYEAYLDRYPDGAFDVIARRRIATQAEQRHGALEEMLALGWQAYERDSLSVPEHDSAMKWARQVLAMEPEHHGALELVHTVIDTYLQWGAQARESGRAQDVTRHLRRVQSLYRHATAEQLTMMVALQDAVQTANNVPVGETTQGSRSSTDPTSDATPVTARTVTGSGVSLLDGGPIDSSLEGLLERLQVRLAARERSR